MTDDNSTLADSRFAEEAKKIVDDMELGRAFVVKLLDRHYEIVDRYVDGHRHSDVPSAGRMLFALFLELMVQDNLRVRLLENGTAEVDVRGVDYD